MQRSWRHYLLAGVLICSCAVAGAQSGSYVKLNLVCSPNNDLYTLLVAGGQPVERFESKSQAIEALQPGSVLFILADQYPFQAVEVTEKEVDALTDKNVKVFAEYASRWSRDVFEKPRQAGALRVATGTKVGVLKNKTLLTVHDCAYMVYPYLPAPMMLDRLAGYNTAVFGLPDWKNPDEEARPIPFLVNTPRGKHLLAATKLSNFATGRFERPDQWREVWQFIIQKMTGQQVELPPFVPIVKPTHAKDAALPADSEMQALHRASQWYHQSKMLVDESWKAQADKAAAGGGMAPWPGVNVQAGDGSHGIFQGFASVIDAAGRNLVRYNMRGDTLGESALALAASGEALNDARNRSVAKNLADFLMNSPLTQGPRAVQDSASFGLIDFEIGAAWGSVYYGDNNARALLGLIGASALLRSDQWDEAITRSLIANFRTAGKNGFRENYIEESVLQERGWQSFSQSEPQIYTPYYQAYLWACYLWAYEQTSFEPFKQKAVSGITAMMNAYPGQWRWTLGMQQERARMILPLAWLVRVEDNEQHRAWLKQIAGDMLALQDASGALREELGPEGNGILPPAKSNEEYGRDESPVIHANGDPGADLMYTINFALLGLHEAAAATGETSYAAAEQKMAEFLCRAQIKSLLRPELDGSWFRGFDFQTWSYWGSDSDGGWGAWSVETGMSHGWITTTLALRKQSTSLWDLAIKADIANEFKELQPAMLPAQ